MRNRKILGIIALLISTPSIAADDVKVIAGYKLWQAEWKDYIFGQNVTSGQEITSGPSIVLRKGNFFIGFNQFNGKFNFTFDSPVEFAVDANNLINFSKIKIERTEQDIYFGASINPNISLLIGHKKYVQDFSTRGAIITNQNNGSIIQEEGTDTFKYEGLFYGASGHTTPSNGLLYFLTVAKIDLEDQGDDPDDLDGTLLEVGAAYTPNGTRIILSASYKSQKYKYDSDGTTAEFTGISAAINYAFSLTP